VTLKLLTAVAAVAGAAAFTFATMIALVEGTIMIVSIDELPLRIVAVFADVVLGTLLVVACIYLATRLAVRIVGVGNAGFPLPPDDVPSIGLQPGDLSKN